MSIYKASLGETPSFHDIPGGLRTRKTVVVRGVPTGSRFEINLQCFPEGGCDIPLHFNPRLEDEAVVRNSRQDGAWQDEERDAEFFPFSEGIPFEVQIYCAKSSFQISVNGVFFCQYNHRMDLESIRAIALEADANFTEIEIFDKLKTSYVSGLKGNMGCGKALRIRAFPNPDAERFDINLHPVKDLDGDHTLHFNPRFSEGRVVRNAKIDGEWGDEEDDGGFPFEQGKMFTMFMVCTDGEYKFFIDNALFCTTPHRCDPESACFVSVTGDVQVDDVTTYDALRPEYVAPLNATLKAGDLFHIVGMVNEGAERMEINLYSSEDRMGDCHLHINPRFGQEAVILNAKEGGEWGGEEEAALPAIFTPGQPFNVLLLVTEDGFKLMDKSSHILCEFGHRMAIEGVTHFGVEGDATFHQARFLPSISTPARFRIPGSVKKGRWISVYVRPNDDADRFEINLQCSGNVYPDCNIPFHFNPRFGDDTTVRNSFTNGEWEAEETDQEDFPFKQGAVCAIEFHMGSDEIQSFVNGRRYVSFPHRCECKEIDNVSLEGDATFYRVAYH